MTTSDPIIRLRQLLVETTNAERLILERPVLDLSSLQVCEKPKVASGASFKEKLTGIWKLMENQCENVDGYIKKLSEVPVINSERMERRFKEDKVFRWNGEFLDRKYTIDGLNTHEGQFVRQELEDGHLITKTVTTCGIEIMFRFIDNEKLIVVANLLEFFRPDNLLASCTRVYEKL